MKVQLLGTAKWVVFLKKELSWLIRHISMDGYLRFNRNRNETGKTHGFKHKPSGVTRRMRKLKFLRSSCGACDVV